MGAVFTNKNTNKRISAAGCEHARVKGIPVAAVSRVRVLDAVLVPAIWRVHGDIGVEASSGNHFAETLPGNGEYVIGMSLPCDDCHVFDRVPNNDLATRHGDC